MSTHAPFAPPHRVRHTRDAEDAAPAVRPVATGRRVALLVAGGAVLERGDLGPQQSFGASSGEGIALGIALYLESEAFVARAELTARDA